MFRNHQQPKTIRLPNFRAATHSSCWFSRASIVTKKRLLRELAAEVDDRRDVGLADHVAGVAQAGFTPQPRADHHRERQAALGADGQDDFSSTVWPARATGSLGSAGIAELRRQADGEVDRLLPVDPVAEESPRPRSIVLVDRSRVDGDSPTRSASCAAVGQSRSIGSIRRTALKRGSLPTLRVVQPAVALVVVEDGVGHRDRARRCDSSITRSM